MSDSTLFRLVLLQPGDVADYLAQEDQSLGKRAPVAVRSTWGTSRNGRFWQANRELIRACGVDDALGFLSNERFDLSRVTGDHEVDFAVTGEYAALTPENRDAWERERRWGYVRNYTVIPPERTAAIAAHLDRLQAYCVEHIERHDVLAHWAFDSTEQLLSNFEPLDYLNDCPGGDEGNNADFYFFALCGLRDLIAQAQGDTLTAIYLNESYESVVKLET